MRFLVLFLLLVAQLSAQWTLQDSHSTASLRGIHSIGNGIAWASGSNGTILRTIDNGKNWQVCAVPPGGDKLDFRGIQAFDADTAIVMSSGKGDLSRLYKTTDGCKSWKLIFTNPDPDGFWDSYRVDQHGHEGILLGDPVSGHLAVWRIDRDESAFQIKRLRRTPAVRKGEAAFAASNSVVFVDDVFFDYWIATGGNAGARVIKRINHDFDSFGFDSFPSEAVPVGTKTESSGIFSLSFRPAPKSSNPEMQFLVGVAVGGDYLKATEITATAAFTVDGAKHWTVATTPPHGYRSAVAYSPTHKAWITVGPNGTDVSTDDGRNWRALRPSANEAPDADQHWNALSLPFVVGAHGRIGILRDDALTTKN